MSTARGAVQGLDSPYSQCNRTYPAACMHACMHQERDARKYWTSRELHIYERQWRRIYDDNEDTKSENLSAYWQSRPRKKLFSQLTSIKIKVELIIYEV